MTTNPWLTEPQERHLREAYDAYVRAPLGQLNVTAEDLQSVCRNLGWTPGFDPLEREGFLPWARRALGITK